MVSEISESFTKTLKQLIHDIKLQKLDGSYNVAVAVVNLFRDLVTHEKWNTAKDLIFLMKTCGKLLAKELPLQTSAENMIRRMLKIVRDEYTAACHEQEELDIQESLHKIVTSEQEVDDYSKTVAELKESILDHISEFHMELETRMSQNYAFTKLEENQQIVSVLPQQKLKFLLEIILKRFDMAKNVATEFYIDLNFEDAVRFTKIELNIENITKEAIKHIYTSEIILTIGKSAIVESFLKEAAKHRKFEVIVCECSPLNYGHDMAISLTNSKISTTLIADSSMFGIMGRVNKVIIGTHTVMANGGLRAISGTHAVALAAKYYSVPVIVLAGLYKLSSQYLHSHEDNFNQFTSPESVLSYSEGILTSRVHVYNPMFDYVPPELVTLFISNAGGHAPSYVYRLLSEMYHQDDNDL